MGWVNIKLSYGSKRRTQVHIGIENKSTLERPPCAARMPHEGGQGCEPWTISPGFDNSTATA